MEYKVSNLAYEAKRYQIFIVNVNFKFDISVGVSNLEMTDLNLQFITTNIYIYHPKLTYPLEMILMYLS
jgi:hypothetical protein